MSIEVRTAVAGDMERVAAIYNHEVLHGVGTFDLEPQPASLFEAKRVSVERGDHFLVAADGDRVLGFAYSGSYRPRPAYAATRETSIYLDPAVRARGLGRRLYTELLARVDASQIHAVLAVIAQPNPASVALHVSLGFEHAGTLRAVGHKFGDWVDTAWYQRIRDAAPVAESAVRGHD